MVGTRGTVDPLIESGAGRAQRGCAHPFKQEGLRGRMETAPKLWRWLSEADRAHSLGEWAGARSHVHFE